MNILTQCLLFTQREWKEASASATWAPENCGPNKQAPLLGESPAVRMAGGRRGRAAGEGVKKELERGGPEEGGRKSQEERLGTRETEVSGQTSQKKAVGPLGWTEHHPVQEGETNSMCLTLAGSRFQRSGVSPESGAAICGQQPYGPLEDSMVSAPARHCPRPPHTAWSPGPPSTRASTQACLLW